VTVTAVAHTLSFYGTGTITLSGVSTSGPLVGTGAYPQRVSLTFTPTAGSLTLTVTGSCKFVQLEVGSFASSFIPTAGSSVPRNADNLVYTFAGNASDTAGSAYVETMTLNWASDLNQRTLLGFGTGAADVLYANNANPTTINTSDQTSFLSKTGLNSTNTGLRKRASSWGAAGLLVTGDGLAPASAAFDGAMPNTEIRVGWGGGQPWSGTVRNLRIYQTQLSSAQLQTITA
jgi:hypothetical protein